MRTYTKNPDFNRKTGEWEDSYIWEYGFDAGYQYGYLVPQYYRDQNNKPTNEINKELNKKRVGDLITYKMRNGSSFSLSVSYTF